MPSAFDRLNKVGFSAPKKLSRFDLSFSNSISQNGGEVMPILCKEVIAGDTFSITANHVTRMITPAVPVMDNLIKDDFYFFVPMRLCSRDSKDWEAIFGTDKGLLSYNEQTAYSTGNALLVKRSGSSGVYYDINPTDLSNNPGIKYGALAALGYPIVLDDNTNNNNSYINLFKANAYIKIWNDWFRDENLQTEIPLANTSVPNYNNTFNFWCILNPGGAFASLNCLYANRLHDYFTSSLPSPQNGNAVLLPLAGNAPIITGADFTLSNPSPVHVKGISSNITDDGALGFTNDGNSNYDLSAGNASSYPGYKGNVYFSNLYADLSQATGATITALRQAFAIQAILERDMLGGHKRYNELLQAHFNTSPNDQTLQRSQYLGSMRSMLSVSQVIQSTPTSNSPLGSTGAFSNTSNSEFIGNFSFNEPGYILGVSVIRPLNTFANAVDKTIYRNRRFDWYWPLLANLSEQPVKLIELDPSANDSYVLGYQEAWQDYRVGRNELHGAFLYDNLVKQWTFADFTSNSNLADVVGYKDTISQTLVAANQPYQFLCNYYFDIKADRPLPMFSIPARLGGYF